MNYNQAQSQIGATRGPWNVCSLIKSLVLQTYDIFSFVYRFHCTTLQYYIMTLYYEILDNE